MTDDGNNADLFVTSVHMDSSRSVGYQQVNVVYRYKATDVATEQSLTTTI
jgi:hypothetical protein